MVRRTGVTLTEVLIAIFIMAIGLLALLSLFPLGAAQMAQALKDQRTAEAAANAGAWARLIWKEACAQKPNSGGTPQFYEPLASPSTRGPTFPPPHKYASVQRFIYAMDDPHLSNTFGQTASNPGPYALPRSIPTMPDPFEPQRILVVPNYDRDMGRLPDSLPPHIAESAHSSYPVFVDPIGWLANDAPAYRGRQLWVGHPIDGSQPISLPIVGPSGRPPIGLIPRRPLYVRNMGERPAISDLKTGIFPWAPLGFAETLGGQSLNPKLATRQRVLSRFSLLDDYTYESTGRLQQNSVGVAERQVRYSWALMFRRFNNNKENRSNVEVTVVVYNGRSIDVPTPEEQFLVTSDTTDSKSVVIDLSKPPNLKARPAVRRGGWVLDATMFNGSGNVQPQGYFYRVVNVDDSDPQRIRLELQDSLRGNSAEYSSRVFVVMENVSEVFSRGVVTQDSRPGDYRPDDLVPIRNP